MIPAHGPRTKSNSGYWTDIQTKIGFGTQSKQVQASLSKSNQVLQVGGDEQTPRGAPYEAKMIMAPLRHPADDEQTPRGAPYEAKTIKAPLRHPADDGKS